MQRPVMNPMDLNESAKPARFRIRWARIWFILKAIVHLLLSDPFDLRNRGLRVDDGSHFQRLLHGILYRLAFIPVIAMLAVAVLVYTGTHPRPLLTQVDPSAVGVYFESVEFASESGSRLQGWLVPAVDARKILAEREHALHAKSPAVVLVHGYGATRAQVLPLIKPLHDEGFLVLAIAVRGAGTLQAAGQTFGVNESLDVRAAIEMLRRRPFVDVNRIAVVGVGTGANAVLLNTDRDQFDGPIVLDSPLVNGDQAVDLFVGSRNPSLRWMNPLCKWAFEIAYEKDLDEINLDRHKHAIQTGKVLMVDEGPGFQMQLSPATISRVVKYLAKTLDEHESSLAAGQ